MSLLDKLAEDPQSALASGLDEAKLLTEAKQLIDPIAKQHSVLDEIYVEGLTPSQVWGQIKLVVEGVNERVWSDEWEDVGSQEEEEGEEKCTEDTERPETASENESESDKSTSESDQSEVYESAQEGEDLGSDEEFFGNVSENGENESDTSVDVAPSKDAFGLNDQFFSIDDFNKQVMAMEEEQSEVDLDAEESSDEEMYHYDDFFKPQVDQKEQKEQKTAQPKQKAVSFDLKEEDYDAAFDSVMADFNNTNEQLSTFEKQQLKLQREIQELEAEAIKEKQWQMKGEVRAKQRDADTLLDEELEFDRAAKPVPVITQETTETIEEIIKRRIREEKFDDLPKRVVSELADFRPSKKVEVSEEKSSKSLAELYEEEYLGKQDDAASAELKQAHDEISVLFDKLNHQLDSLCSAHFIPKPKERQLEVKVQTSTISMEDAQPLTMSDAQTLAPQEVYKPVSKVGKDEVLLKSGVVMSKAELSREEKQRLRRAKKRKQHNERREDSKKKRVGKAQQV
ncbi:hypothetical protein KL930_002948 [Ogataea haglerorum]|nr:hypothetical protein KL915_003759 [Ogataea haglerorum]KAG7704649.1 hypothetical protein KL914_004040 [Ogataea haglerorum]KAG7704911.1 hypothetical protein KL950_004084 [Ogataea haglerorum]KAG7739340.1 hypothetical protein KL932_003434 [Ogataea haglerorum]KAG7777274.1 hypothetical protein KL930_002948 [Ogataea haglerorum]